MRLNYKNSSMNLGGNTGKRIVLCKGGFFFILYENSNLGVEADVLSPPAKKICDILCKYYCQTLMYKPLIFDVRS